ncbi:hypothetical protein KJ866_04620 [Patescibacteria group bacterium]|nr:hypothetical protein [Patescibacteria group bacterium]
MFDLSIQVGLELSQTKIMKNQELSRMALNLSLAIYRITAKLPAGEVLIEQMRGSGNEIAATLSVAEAELSSAGDLAEENLADIEKKINQLRIYFQIAKAQNWVRLINWSILDFEYCKLQREVIFRYRELTQIGNIANKHELEDKDSIMSHNIKAPKKAASLKPTALSGRRLNERQIKIMGILDKNRVLKMSDLIPLFKNNISERTLRNELQDMVRAGLIKKKGTNRFTEYFKK